MAYPIQTRIKALEYSVSGLTDEQVGDKLDISKYTVNAWKRKLLATGNLDKKKTVRKSGIPYKYKPQKIKEILDKSRAVEKTKGIENVKTSKNIGPMKTQASVKTMTVKDKGAQGTPTKQKPKKKKDKKKNKHYLRGQW